MSISIPPFFFHDAGAHGLSGKDFLLLLILGRGCEMSAP